MEVEFTSTKNDWDSFQTYQEQHLLSKVKPPYVNGWKTWIVIGIIMWLLAHNYQYIHFGTALFVVCLLAAPLYLYFAYQNRLKKLLYELSVDEFVGDIKFSITEKAISVERSENTACFQWSAVKNIVRSDGLIIVFLSANTAFIFPESKIDDADNLYTHIIECNKLFKAS